MNYRLIADERCRKLFTAWTVQPAVLVTALSAADLLSRTTSLDWLDRKPNALDAKTAGLASPKLADAVVLKPAGPAGDASIWVPAGFPDYRKAFLAFMGEIYGGSPDTTDLSGYDIDHLLNKKRATSADVLVRIEAIPSGVNQAWGRLFEKNASNPNFYANQNRAVRSMSWMIAAKISGQMPPSGPRDAAGITRVARFFAGFRALELTAAEIESALKDMLAFAYSLNV